MEILSNLLLYGSYTLVALLLLYVVYSFISKHFFLSQYPVPFLGLAFGQSFRTLTGITNFVESEEEYYAQARQHSAPIVAISDVIGGGYSLYVTDLDIIKKITVKDFDNFVNLRPIPNESKYIQKMMVFMANDPWKHSRSKMTPAFTTGKIKRIHNILLDSSDKMVEYLQKEMGYPHKKSIDLDFAKVIIKFLMHAIANTVFGIDSKSFETPLDKLASFEEIGKQLEFRIDAWTLFQFIVMSISPSLGERLQFDIIPKSAQNYFAEMIKDVMKQRRQSGQKRDDFLQLMMDIQEGVLKDEEDNKNVSGLEFDDDSVVANALLFFIAGFDTTQSTLLFLLYSLALYPEVQQKLYEEITTVKERHDGKLTYDALAEMTYFDRIIAENQRLYPAAPRVERECSADYTVEETGLKIKKGAILVLPVHGIHMDERYWPNPKKFDPDRFLPEEKQKRHSYAYLPFGQGPRSCIGMRFALVGIKSVIATLLTSFKLSPCSKTQIPVKFDGSLSVKPLGGMWLNAEVREEE